MNYTALDLNAGKPLSTDLVWSALPDSPVIQPSRRRGVLRRFGVFVRAGRRVETIVPALQPPASPVIETRSPPAIFASYIA
jgi:hypothetical protein